MERLTCCVYGVTVNFFKHESNNLNTSPIAQTPCKAKFAHPCGINERGRIMGRAPAVRQNLDVESSRHEERKHRARG